MKIPAVLIPVDLAVLSRRVGSGGKRVLFAVAAFVACHFAVVTAGVVGVAAVAVPQVAQAQEVALASNRWGIRPDGSKRFRVAWDNDWPLLTVRVRPQNPRGEWRVYEQSGAGEVLGNPFTAHSVCDVVASQRFSCRSHQLSVGAGLFDGVAYDVQIRTNVGTNQARIRHFSASKTRQVGGTKAPAPATDAASPQVRIGVVSRQVTVSWDAVGGATGYRVRWRLQDDGTGNPGHWWGRTDGGGIGNYEHGVSTGAAREYTIGGLTNGSAYEFQVVTVNQATLGNWSASTHATPKEPTVPNPPGNMRSLGTGGLNVLIGWNESVGALSYELQWGGLSGWPGTSGALPADARKYLVQNFGSFITFRVRAGNALGWSNWNTYLENASGVYNWTRGRVRGYTDLNRAGRLTDPRIRKLEVKLYDSAGGFLNNLPLSPAFSVGTTTYTVVVPRVADRQVRILANPADVGTVEVISTVRTYTLTYEDEAPLDDVDFTKTGTTPHTITGFSETKLQQTNIINIAMSPVLDADSYLRATDSQGTALTITPTLAADTATYAIDFPASSSTESNVLTFSFNYDKGGGPGTNRKVYLDHDRAATERGFSPGTKYPFTLRYGTNKIVWFLREVVGNEQNAFQYTLTVNRTAPPATEQLHTLGFTDPSAVDIPISPSTFSGTVYDYTANVNWPVKTTTVNMGFADNTRVRTVRHNGVVLGTEKSQALPRPSAMQNVPLIVGENVFVVETFPPGAQAGDTPVHVYTVTITRDEHAGGAFLSPTASVTNQTLRLLWTKPTTQTSQHGIAVQVKRASESWVEPTQSLGNIDQAQSLPSGAVLTALTDAQAGSGKAGVDISLPPNVEWDARLVAIGLLKDSTNPDDRVTSNTVFTVAPPGGPFRTLNNVAELTNIAASKSIGGARDLQPAFSTAVSEYWVTLPRGDAGGLNLHPAPVAGATVSGWTNPVSVTTNRTGSVRRTITVTSEDGTATKEYVVNVAVPLVEDAPGGANDFGARVTPSGGARIDFTPASAETVLYETTLPRAAFSQTQTVAFGLNWKGGSGPGASVGLQHNPESARVGIAHNGSQNFALRYGKNVLEVRFRETHDPSPNPNPIIYQFTINRPAPTERLTEVSISTPVGVTFDQNFDPGIFDYTAEIAQVERSATLAFDVPSQYTVTLKKGATTLGTAGRTGSFSQEVALDLGDNIVVAEVYESGTLVNRYTFNLARLAPPGQRYLQPTASAPAQTKLLRVLWNAPTRAAADYGIQLQVKLASEPWLSPNRVSSVSSVTTAEQVPQTAESTVSFTATAPADAGAGKAGMDIHGLFPGTAHDIRLVVIGQLADDISVASAEIVPVVTGLNTLRAGFAPTELSVQNVRAFSPPFNADTLDYTAFVAYNNNSLQSSPISLRIKTSNGETVAVSSANANDFKGNFGVTATAGGVSTHTTGVLDTLRNVNGRFESGCFPQGRTLNVGSLVTYQVTVASENGATSKTYGIRFISTPSGASINIRPSGLAAHRLPIPGFNPQTKLEFTADAVPQHVSYVHLHGGVGVPNNADYRVIADGTASPWAGSISSGQPVGNVVAHGRRQYHRFPVGAANIVELRYRTSGGSSCAFAPFGSATPVTYQIKFAREEMPDLLTSVDITNAILNPVFYAMHTAYTSDVAFVTNSVNVTAGVDTGREDGEADTVGTLRIGGTVHGTAFTARNAEGNLRWENVELPVGDTVLRIETFPAGATTGATPTRHYDFTLSRQPSGPPLPPRKMAVAASDASSFTPAWEEAETATGYKIRYREANPIGMWRPGNAGQTTTFGAHADCGGIGLATGCVTGAKISGLHAGAGYAVQVKAVNSRGESAWSDSMLLATGGAPASPPGAPATVALATLTGETLRVTWTPPAPVSPPVNPTDYRVRWRTAVSAGAEKPWQGWVDPAPTIGDSDAGVSAGAGTSYDIPNLPLGAAYDVQVAAVNNAILGAWSDTVTSNASEVPQPPPVTPPDPPAGIAAFYRFDESAGKIYVVWDPPSDANSLSLPPYQLRFRVNAPLGLWQTPRVSGEASAADCTDTAVVMPAPGASAGCLEHAFDAQPGVTYAMQIRARNAGGDGAWGGFRTATFPGTAATAPGKPANLTAAGEPGHLALDWEAPTGTVTEYRVRWRTSGHPGDDGAHGTNDANEVDPGAWQGWAGVPPDTNDNEHGAGTGSTDTEYALVLASAAQSYDAQVAAVNQATLGPWSDTASGTAQSASSDAQLSDLRLYFTTTIIQSTPNQLSNFAPGTTAYSANAGSRSRVTVQAQLQDANAQVSIDGNSLGGGSNAISRIVDLVPGENTVEVVVTAENLRTKRTYTLTINRNYNRAPDKITGVAAQSGGDGEVTAAWSMPPRDAVSYSLRYRLKTPPGLWSPVAAAQTAPGGALCAALSLAAGCLRATLQNLHHGAEYQFQVRAQNPAQSGDWSDSVDATAGGTKVTAPGAPREVTPTPGHNRIALKWAAPNSGTVTQYRVRWRTSAHSGADGKPGTTDDVAAGAWQGWTEAAPAIGDSDFGIALGRGTLAYTLLLPGQNGVGYDVAVAAVNEASLNEATWEQRSAAPRETTASPPSPPGSPPRAMPSAQRLGALRVDWQWDGAHNGAVVERFRMRYRETGAAAWIPPGDEGAIVAGTEAVRHEITGLAPGVEYEVQYAAENEAGIGNFSAVTSASTARASGAPDAPTVTVEATFGGLNVSWTNAEFHGGPGVSVSRVRWRDANGPGAWQDARGDNEDGQNVGALRAYAISGLQPGHSYHVQVRSENELPGGVSAWSAQVDGSPTVHSVRVTPHARTKVYGAADPSFAYDTTALISGDARDDVFSAVPFTRADGESVGTYHYILKPNPADYLEPDARNKYTVTLFDPAPAFVITQKSLTYTSASATKTYDGSANPPAALGGSFSGVVSGDANKLALQGGMYEDADGNGPLRAQDAGAGKMLTGFTLSGDAASNYSLTFSISGDIRARPTTLTYTAKARVYDATKVVPTDGRTEFVPQILGGDAVSPDFAAAVYENANAGERKTITGLAVTGAQAYNYDFTAAAAITARGNVNQRPLVLQAGGSGAHDAAVDLDDYAALLTVDTSGSGLALLSGQGLSELLTGELLLEGRVPAMGAGKAFLKQGMLNSPNSLKLKTTAISAEIGAPDVNYALDFKEGEYVFLDIDRQKLIVTPAVETSVVYGGDPPATVDFTLTLDSGATFHPGHDAAAVKAAFTADESIFALPAAGTDAGTYAYALKKEKDLPLTDEFKNRYEFAVSEAVDVKKYVITPRAAELGALTFTRVYDGTAELAGAAISGDAIAYYGGDNFTLGFSAANDATFDDKNVGAAKAIVDIDAADFELTATSGDAANYQIDVSSASYTGVVTKFATTFEWSPPARVYDGTTAVPSASHAFDPAIFSDEISVSLSGATFETADAGVNKEIKGVVFGADPASDLDNYEITANPAATITKRPLVVSASGQGPSNIAVNRADYANLLIDNSNSGAGEGALSPDTLASLLEGSLAIADLPQNALEGTVDLTMGSLKLKDGHAATNYELRFTPGKFVYTNPAKAELVITPASVSVVYGDTAPVTFTYAVSGDFRDGDTADTTFFTETPFVVKDLSPNVGQYVYELKPESALSFAEERFKERYAFSVDTSSAVRYNITRRDVAIATLNFTRAYDGSTAIAGSTIEGGAVTTGVDRESFTLGLKIDAVAAYTSADVKTGIVVSGVDAGDFELIAADSEKATNYNIVLAQTEFTGNITPLETLLTLRASRVYDATTAIPAKDDLTELAFTPEIISGDKVVADLSGAVFASADAAAGIAITGVSVTDTDSDDDTGNYAVTYDAQGDITARALNVTASGEGAAAPNDEQLGVGGGLLSAGDGNLADAHTSLTFVLSGKLTLGDRESDDAAVLARGGGTSELGEGTLALVTAHADNYDFTFTTGTYTYTDPGKQTLVVTPAALTYTYGDDAPASHSYTIALKSGSEFFSGDTAGTTFFAETPFVFAETNAGDYDFVLAETRPLADSGDAQLYDFELPSGAQYTIARRASVITATLERVYTGNTNFGNPSIVSPAFSNRHGSETFTLAFTPAGSAEFRDAKVGDGIAMIGLDLTADFEITAGAGSDVDNYAFDISGIRGKITPKEVSIDGAVVISKTYDGTTGIGAGTEVSGNVGATISPHTFDLIVTAGTFESAAAGTPAFNNPTFALGNAQGVGADASNYSLPAISNFSARINTKEVTVGAVTLTKTYDGDDTITSAVLGNHAVGGAVDQESLTLQISNRAAAKYAQTTVGDSISFRPAPVFALDGATKDNYTLPSISVTGVITAKNLTVANLLLEKEYDGEAAITGASVSGDISGAVTQSESFTLAVASGAQAVYASENAAQTVSVTGFNPNRDLDLTGTTAANYQLAAATTATGRITKKPVEAAAATLTKVYDGNTTITHAVFAGGGIAAGDTVVGDALTYTFTPSAAGSYESADVATGITMHDIADRLTLTATTGSADNYEVTLPEVTGVITASPVSVDLTKVRIAKTYDGTVTAGNSEVTAEAGAVGGVIAGQSLNLGVASANYASADAGADLDITGLRFTLASGDGGATNPNNYALAVTDLQNLDEGGTIRPRPLDAVITAQGGSVSKVYDGTTGVPGAVRSGVGFVTAAAGSIVDGQAVNGDEVRVGDGAYDSANVDEAEEITFTTLAGGKSGNYTLREGTVTAAITPKTVNGASVTTGTPSKQYDGTTDAPQNVTGTFTEADVLEADRGKIALAGGVYNDANVSGANALTLVFAAAGSGTAVDAANYAPNPSSVTAAITARALTVLAPLVNQATRPDVEDLKFTVETLFPPDTIATIFTGHLTYGTASAGVTPIVIGNLELASGVTNYTFDSATGFTEGIYSATGSILALSGSGDPHPDDGIIVARYLLGIGAAATADEQLLGGLTSKQDADPAEIRTRLDAAKRRDLYDVDAKNGTTATDGIMLARYLLGVRCDSLTEGMTDVACATVETNIKALLNEEADPPPTQ